MKMEFSEYQRHALETDETRHSSDPILVPILGLAGEAGSVLSEFKKSRRDSLGDHSLRDVIRTELGDVLWYTAVIAKRFDLDLNDVAESNLDKVRGLWLYPSVRPPPYDADQPIWEQLPGRFEIQITPVDSGRVALTCEGVAVGDPLTDNAYEEDGYRFHDVFHFAYAAIMGWSPVVRGIMGLKRKSSPQKDTVDDGGRAIVIEEGIAAFVFSCAKGHLFSNGEPVETYILQTIQTMVQGLEVRSRTQVEWRRAIQVGFDVFRRVKENNGGVISVDVEGRDVQYLRAI